MNRIIEEEIRDYVAVEIINKRYKDGDKLKSRRFLASKFKVNPSYVEEAYKIMLKDRIIERRVDSYYIKVSDARVNSLREEFINRYTNDFLNDLSLIGASLDDGIATLNKRKIANG